MSTNGALALGEVRSTLETVLAEPGGPAVLVDYPDMVTPPALVVIWDDPWLEEPQTMGPCETVANFVVLCVGGRIDAGGGVDTVEQLAAFTIDKLRGDTHKWPLRAAQSPREWVISNVHYLGARLGYRVPVSV